MLRALRFIRYFLNEILKRLNAVFHVNEIVGVITSQPTMLQNLHNILTLRASAQYRNGLGLIFDVFLRYRSEESNNLSRKNLFISLTILWLKCLTSSFNFH